ncbi:hypothetical protein [uncultured Campylobacter sp.]|uniref:hypothetical protein n=1 Tax=uncultured Campylobacter sp. TaxID=218934 RepID=UPI0026141E66|nr:hypothetical protein [uncultured Campylobacter sp.]
MTIYPCCYLSAGAVSACRFDPDRLPLGADICVRIDRYCAKRRRIASAQGKGGSAFHKCLARRLRDEWIQSLREMRTAAK